jgi:hypothetical protein
MSELRRLDTDVVPEDHGSERDRDAFFFDKILDQDRDTAEWAAMAIGGGLEAGGIDPIPDHGVDGWVDGRHPFGRGFNEFQRMGVATRNQFREPNGVVPGIVRERFHGGNLSSSNP